VKPIEKLDWYLIQIAQLWPDFKDDGLSWFPDWIYRLILRHNITPAGRAHDWGYCSRCHKRREMTSERRLFADRALRKHARELLHGHFRITPLVLYAGVRLFGRKAWNSCGPDEGERCRHDIEQPVWMRALGGA
jgi:hypothetical protein